MMAGRNGDLLHINPYFRATNVFIHVIYKEECRTVLTVMKIHVLKIRYAIFLSIPISRKKQ
jgi:hypothetical protein